MSTMSPARFAGYLAGMKAEMLPNERYPSNLAICTPLVCVLDSRDIHFRRLPADVLDYIDGYDAGEAVAFDQT